MPCLEYLMRYKENMWVTCCTQKRRTSRRKNELKEGARRNRNLLLAKTKKNQWQHHERATNLNCLKDKKHKSVIESCTKSFVSHFAVGDDFEIYWKREETTTMVIAFTVTARKSSEFVN